MRRRAEEEGRLGTGAGTDGGAGSRTQQYSNGNEAETKDSR